MVMGPTPEEAAAFIESNDTEAEGGRAWPPHLQAQA